MKDIKPEEILAKTLPVKTKKDRILVDTNRPSIDQTVHSIQWNFTAPKVEAPTMFQISVKIQVSDQSWGCFTRGILVNP